MDRSLFVESKKLVKVTFGLLFSMQVMPFLVYKNSFEALLPTSLSMNLVNGYFLISVCCVGLFFILQMRGLRKLTIEFSKIEQNLQTAVTKKNEALEIRSMDSLKSTQIQKGQTEKILELEELYKDKSKASEFYRNYGLKQLKVLDQLLLNIQKIEANILKSSTFKKISREHRHLESLFTNLDKLVSYHRNNLEVSTLEFRIELLNRSLSGPSAGSMKEEDNQIAIEAIEKTNLQFDIIYKEYNALLLQYKEQKYFRKISKEYGANQSQHISMISNVLKDLQVATIKGNAIFRQKSDQNNVDIFSKEINCGAESRKQEFEAESNLSNEKMKGNVLPHGSMQNNSANASSEMIMQ